MMLRPRPPILPLLLAGLLVACGEGDGRPASAAAQDTGASPARQILPGGDVAAPGLAGCGWVRVFDPTLVNVAFPDTAANYWLALVPNPGPAGEVELAGRYPAVRYFSFNTYELSSAPNDALADFEISPDPGQANPFTGPAQLAPGVARGGSYRVQLAFTAAPAARAANTLYVDDLITLQDRPVPNPALAVLVYRTYVPDAGQDLLGGGGLPTIGIRRGDQHLRLAERDDCTTLVNQTLTTAGIGAINTLANAVDLPDLPGGPAFPAASDPAEFLVFRGLGPGLLAPGLPEQVRAIRARGGFFSNVHNKYVYAAFSRNFGGLYLVRGKAPRIPEGARAGQLRYWSLCQNELATQRVTACVRDDQATLDRDGYWNVVVSDAGDRPDNARPAQGFDWLPWGPYYDGQFIYRHMLPDAGFAEAIQRVGENDDAGKVMGDYFPQATYCSPAVFAAQAGRSPAQVFDACRRSRATLSRPASALPAARSRTPDPSSA